VIALVEALVTARKDSNMLCCTVFALAALVSSGAAASLKWRELAAEEKTQYTWEHFVGEFGGTGEAHSRSTFEANLAKIHAHNAKGLSWTEGVNQFTDMSEEEFARFKGKLFNGHDSELPRMKYSAGIAVEDLPASIDWRDKGAVTPTKNQGGCGSCWAFSATESVESAVFMSTGTLLELAPQELVDCIPNPNSCGGTGGCSGSTEEYGFAWAMIYGMANASTYNYTAKTGKECLLGEDGRDAVAGVSNFVKLPSNDYGSLMQAIATVGPVSISVDASWGSYEKGVYGGCSKNHTMIDHAVQLVGYGTEDGQDYFLVRNSWVSQRRSERFRRQRDPLPSSLSH
jgi:cathepsin L